MEVKIIGILCKYMVHIISTKWKTYSAVLLPRLSCGLKIIIIKRRGGGTQLTQEVHVILIWIIELIS